MLSSSYAVDDLGDAVHQMLERDYNCNDDKCCSILATKKPELKSRSDMIPCKQLTADVLGLFKTDSNRCGDFYQIGDNGGGHKDTYYRCRKKGDRCSRKGGTWFGGAKTCPAAAVEKAKEEESALAKLLAPQPAKVNAAVVQKDDTEKLGEELINGNEVVQGADEQVEKLDGVVNKDVQTTSRLEALVHRACTESGGDPSEADEHREARERTLEAMLAAVKPEKDVGPAKLAIDRVCPRPLRHAEHAASPMWEEIAPRVPVCRRLVSSSTSVMRTL